MLGGVQTGGLELKIISPEVRVPLFAESEFANPNTALSFLSANLVWVEDFASETSAFSGPHESTEDEEDLLDSSRASGSLPSEGVRGRF